MTSSFIRRTTQPGGYPAVGYHDKLRPRTRSSARKHEADNSGQPVTQPDTMPAAEPVPARPGDISSESERPADTQLPSWPLTGMNHFLTQEIIRQLNASADDPVSEKKPPEKAPKAEKLPHDDLAVASPRVITLTLGLFFDGTGNNAINIANMLSVYKAEHFDLNDSDAQSLLARCTKENMGISGDSANSYCGYYTNIHWLSQLYKTGVTDQADHFQQAIYIEGAGTHTQLADNLIGEGLGIADTGVIAKTDQAIIRLTETINSVLKRLETNTVISTLQFDLFGFSRGAAAARHFANLIHSEDKAVKDAIHQSIASTGASDLPAISIRFIGLFDTVAAIGIPMNGFNPHSADTGEVKLTLSPGIAAHVFQLTAQHECRFNFPLNSISPDWPELALPGVHADIGGGYLPVVREDLFLTRPEAATVALDQPGEKTDAWQRTTRQLQMIDSAATIAPVLRTHDIAVETWFDDRVQSDRYDQPQKRSYAAMTLRNRVVKNDWSRVALRVMLDAANDAGVSFNPLPSNEEALQLPSSLLPLCNKARAMGKAVRTGQAVSEFTSQEIATIAKNYIHCSANWNMIVAASHHQYAGETALSDVTDFIHRPDDKWRRTVYNMQGLKV